MDFLIITGLSILFPIVGFYVGRYLWKNKGAMRNDHGEIIGYYYNKGQDRFYSLAFFMLIPMGPFMWYLRFFG